MVWEFKWLIHSGWMIPKWKCSIGRYSYSSSHPRQATHESHYPDYLQADDKLLYTSSSEISSTFRLTIPEISSIVRLTITKNLQAYRLIVSEISSTFRLTTTEILSTFRFTNTIFSNTFQSDNPWNFKYLQADNHLQACRLIVSSTFGS